MQKSQTNDSVPFKVRQATSSDLAQILKVNRLCLKKPDVNGLIQARPSAEFEKLINICKYFIIAECNGSLVGYLTVLDESAPYLENEIFSFYPTRYSNFVFVDQVATIPEYRRKGVGRAMYKYFLGKENKRVLVDFLVKPRNQESIAFHESLGFKSLGDIIRLKNGMEAEVYEYKK